MLLDSGGEPDSLCILDHPGFFTVCKYGANGDFFVCSPGGSNIFVGDLRALVASSLLSSRCRGSLHHQLPVFGAAASAFFPDANLLAGVRR